jgi:hypothetical protein
MAMTTRTENAGIRGRLSGQNRRWQGAIALTVSFGMAVVPGTILVPSLARADAETDALMIKLDQADQNMQKTPQQSSGGAVGGLKDVNESIDAPSSGPTLGDQLKLAAGNAAIDIASEVIRHLLNKMFNPDLSSEERGAYADQLTEAQRVQAEAERQRQLANGGGGASLPGLPGGGGGSLGGGGFNGGPGTSQGNFPGLPGTGGGLPGLGSLPGGGLPGTGGFPGGAIDPLTGLPTGGFGGGGGIDPLTGLPTAGGGSGGSGFGGGNGGSGFGGGSSGLPGAGGVKGSVDPVTGLPTGGSGAIDPITGRPLEGGAGAIDPFTGQPLGGGSGGGGLGGGGAGGGGAGGGSLDQPGVGIEQPDGGSGAGGDGSGLDSSLKIKGGGGLAKPRHPRARPESMEGFDPDVITVTGRVVVLRAGKSLPDVTGLSPTDSVVARVAAVDAILEELPVLEAVANALGREVPLVPDILAKGDKGDLEEFDADGFGEELPGGKLDGLGDDDEAVGASKPFSDLDRRELGEESAVGEERTSIEVWIVGDPDHFSKNRYRVHVPETITDKLELHENSKVIVRGRIREEALVNEVRAKVLGGVAEISLESIIAITSR